MNLHEQLSPEVQQLIAEYNTNSKFNTFLYNNEDCHKLFKEKFMPENTYPSDRFVFVDRCNRIEVDLTPTIHKLYHGRQVQVQSTGRSGTFTGIIEHELTRTYTPSYSSEPVTDKNNVPFRGLNDGNALDAQTIALWVNTGNRDSTHLYTADRITLL